MKKENKYNVNIFKILRLCNDLQVSELAEEVGISQQYVRDIENNNRYPSEKVLLKYCDAFDISIDRFKDLESIITRAGNDKTLNNYQKVLFFILTKLVKL